MVGAPDRSELRIVDVTDVLPHEIADSGREQRIERRLSEDGVLRDPLMVGAVAHVDRYVLLDGTNRRLALTALGFSRTVVQVLDYSDSHAVELRTWCHAVSMTGEDLLRGVAVLDGLEIDPLQILEAPDVLREASTLAVMHDGRQGVALRRTGPGVTSRAEQLRRLVALYEPSMSRADCNPDDVEERAVQLNRDARASVTLVAFPAFSRSRVLSMARESTPIPAGITRHIIKSGRILRVNVPLQLLEDRMSLDEANAELREHLSSLRPRYYEEPTILYDS